MSVRCGEGHSCPFLYSCDITTNMCNHLPVFPITPIPGIIYCIFPFAAALCNLTGNSMGEFKVLLIMDMLNYSASQATVFVYPLATGSALFNWISYIFKRHPIKETSLVDYNVVNIIIPSVLFGSTMGAIVNKFIPNIASDSILIVLLSFFCLKFILRFKTARKNELKEDNEALLQSSVKENGNSINSSARRTTELKENISPKITELNNNNNNIPTFRNTEIENKEEFPVIPVVEDMHPGLRDQLLYEKSLHLRDIAGTVVVFFVFEILSFLAQGKIIHFTICDYQFPLGMAGLTVAYLIFNIGIYFSTKKKMLYYEAIGYKYDLDLHNIRKFVLIAASGFIGGFNGGAFGLGSSTTIIAALLYLDIEPIVVSATVGFQVVYGGLANSAEALALDEIEGTVWAFFFLITLVGGGIGTFFLRKAVEKYKPIRVTQVLMLGVALLTGLSTIALIANIAVSYKIFGSSYMNDSSFNCG